MSERELQDLLISILRSELTEIEIAEDVKCQLNTQTIYALYRLSKSHDLAHIVSGALNKLGLIGNDEISMKFQKQEVLSVLRCERIKYEFNEICKAFDSVNIPYIPLKGSVIRDYYPKDSMRTSCDIDILVHENDLDRAIDELCSVGYTSDRERKNHDVSLFSPSGVHLELHYNVLERKDNLDIVLSRAWEYAVPTIGAKHEFTKEFFAFHFFAHMSYHFISGGCGVRPFMDWFLIKQKTGVCVENLKDLLDESGIYTFAVVADEVSDAWFGEKEHTELTRDMQEYILNAGVYGSLENYILMNRRTKQSKAGYVLRRVFLPYKTMVYMFPSLKRVPILLPFFYVVRMFRTIKRGNLKKGISEVKINENISENQIEFTRSLAYRLGL